MIIPQLPTFIRVCMFCDVVQSTAKRWQDILYYKLAASATIAKYWTIAVAKIT